MRKNLVQPLWLDLGSQGVDHRGEVDVHECNDSGEGQLDQCRDRDVFKRPFKVRLTILGNTQIIEYSNTALTLWSARKKADGNSLLPSYR
jgi:alpha-L-arabinofuranosidase